MSKKVKVGDKINLKGNKNFGYISRKKAQKIISQSRFTISNPENLYSFFVQDCLANHFLSFFADFVYINYPLFTGLKFKSLYIGLA